MKNFAFVRFLNVSLPTKGVIVVMDAKFYLHILIGQNVDASERKENVIQIYVRSARIQDVVVI